MQALALYYQSEESREGVRAFQEKRPPVSASTRDDAPFAPASRQPKLTGAFPNLLPEVVADYAENNG